ncbi:hypothetical protein [Nonomuraea sp. NPDC049400]|uniref:hypothetical protein n=1 Tax=Nonomuraea sp. NPDC049400 TaxID=3364352 RepID=UPI0037B9EF39
MLVILAIAAIAILACVVLVSIGRGGELTEFPPDVPPLDLPEPGQLTAVDFMALQLPVNLVGYHTASVDETLRRAANAISARDTRIAVLEQRVSELLASRLHARQEVYAAPGAGPRTEHSPEPPAVARELPESGDPVSSSGATISWDGTADLRRPPEDPEWRIPQGDDATAQEEAEASELTDAEAPAEEAAAAEAPAEEAAAAEVPAEEAAAAEVPAEEAAADEPAADAEAPVDESAAVGSSDDEHGDQGDRGVGEPEDELKPDESVDDDPDEVQSGENDRKTADEPQDAGEAVPVAQGKDGDERP